MALGTLSIPSLPLNNSNTSSGGTPATALLTETSDPLITEAGDYIITE